MNEARTQRVVIDLHSAQFDFYWDPSFASLFVGGVGSGKTFVGARKALHKGLRYPKTLGLIAANTHTQLNQSTLVELWDAFSEIGFTEEQDYIVNKRPPDSWRIKSRFTRHTGVITLRNGAQIVTRSLYNWRPILGLTLGWAWIDEARDASEEAFRAVLSRLRCKKIRKHQVFITTTPNGFDWLYDFFDAEPGRNPELFKQRRYFAAKTSDNVHLPMEYVDVLLSAYDEQLAKQELEGQWIDVYRGRVYWAFDRAMHVGVEAVFDRLLPVYLCCDFNVSPMTWIVAQKKRGTGTIGGAPYQKEVLNVIDQIVINTSSTQEALEEFRARGYDPAKTVVFGDSTGHHSTTISDYMILHKGGLRDIRVPKSNPLVLDRVAAVNAKLKNAKGEVGVRIAPKCSALIEDFLRVGFKSGTRTLDKSDLNRTHASDAIGYCITRCWPLVHSGKLHVRGERY